MAKRRKKNVASRGFVNNTILECLVAGDKYGYEIIKEVEDKSGGKIVLKQPSLYSSLRRFETKGYISSYWGDSDIGGRRHYYSITDEGRNYFNSEHPADADEDDMDDIQEDVENNEEPEELPEDSSYEIDETQDQEEEIPVVSDNYINSFRDFDLGDKVSELIGEEPEEEGLSQPHSLFNTVNKPEEDLEYIKEQEDAKEQDPIEEQPQAEEKFYFKDGESVEQVDLEKESPTLSEHSFVQEDIFSQPKEEKENKPIPMIQEEESFNLEDLRKQALQNTESFSKTEYYESPLKQELDKKAEQYEQQDMFTAPVEETHCNIIVDEDGITRAANDMPTAKREPKIFDNVGVRTVPQKTYIPLGSDEPEEKPSMEVDEDVAEAKEINYKQILGDLYESEDDKVEHNIITNPFERKIISVEPEKEVVQPKQDVEPDIEVDSELVIRPYVPSRAGKNTKEYDFILYNKARAMLAFFISIFALIQTSVFFIVLKSKGGLSKLDLTIFITCISLAIVAAIGFAIPWLLRPHRRKLQKFNFGLDLFFCTLTFLVISIVVYAINSFLGLNSSNVSEYLSTLLLPIILALNIVIAPIIYKLITLKKDMY